MGKCPMNGRGHSCCLYISLSCQTEQGRAWSSVCPLHPDGGLARGRGLHKWAEHCCSLCPWGADSRSLCAKYFAPASLLPQARGPLLLTVQGGGEE